MTAPKRKIHRVDFQPRSEIIRQGIPFHMNAESWDYGRNHAVPLWTEYVIYPAILSRGYKFVQPHQSMSSFELVLEGSMIFQLDDTRLEVKPGELCLIPAGKTKKLEVQEDCRKIVFGICGQLHLPLLATTGILSKSVLRLGNLDPILSILKELHRLLKEKSERSISHISALTMELVMELSREAGKVPDPQLADALHFLEYHQSEPFHVKALAAELHVTPDFLNRLFLKELGIPPKHYLIEQRMLLAATLLASTALTVQEISSRCGYKTQFSFSKEFRKRYGLSPLAFRKNSRQRECMNMT